MRRCQSPLTTLSRLTTAAFHQILVGAHSESWMSSWQFATVYCQRYKRKADRYSYAVGIPEQYPDGYQGTEHGFSGR